MFVRPLIATVIALLPLVVQAADAVPPVTLAAPIVTRHSGVFNNVAVDYDARVEPIDVKDAAGKPGARLVAVSYVAANRSDAASRPVLFIFNGGSIGPSSILHMGAFGPKRVHVPDDIKADPSTFKLVDNVYTVLDVADLVFFDPATTGFSRTLPGVDPANYFSTIADSQQLVQLIIEWSTKHGRAASPKYLIGESYGTNRAVEAANQAQKTSMPLSGVMLLGQAVNIIEYAQRPANIISYVVSLPTLAATAWSHDRAKRKGRGFDRFISDAQAFARSDYLAVLFQGNAASDRDRKAVARRLEEYSGISADYYLAHDLRITKEDYRRELFKGQLLGVNDARYIGPLEAGDPFRVVPQAYSKFFLEYARDDLKIGDIGAYLSGSPVKGLDGWDWGANKTPFGDWPYPKLISEVMQKNPNFRVLVANGYYDTQTTVGAMDYLVTQADWPRDRVKSVYYQGGHMPYSIESTLKLMMNDVRELVRR